MMRKLELFEFIFVNLTSFKETDNAKYVFKR